MAVQHILKLRTYLEDQGHSVEGGLIIDPFDATAQVVVRDARSFGYQPIVDDIATEHTIEDYINHWFPEAEWERDENVIFYLDYKADLANLANLANSLIASCLVTSLAASIQLSLRQLKKKTSV